MRRRRAGRSRRCAIPLTSKDCAITLAVNGVERQRGDIGQMIWSVPEVIAQLSKQVSSSRAT